MSSVNGKKRTDDREASPEETVRPTIADLTADELEKLKPLMDKLKDVAKSDAYIVGIGHRNEFGEVVADRCHCHGVDREFIDNYSQIAAKDSAAQLFLSNATSVLSISTLEDYPFNATNAADVGRYLRKRRVAHLLLSGVDSSRGIAWLTLYKLNDQTLEFLDIELPNEYKVTERAKRIASQLKGFTPDECEKASYIIRAGLFEWQLACDFKQMRPPYADRYKMIRLSPVELDVAVRVARGYSKKQMRDELKIGNDTINKHKGAMFNAGFTETGMAKRLIGELPEPRIRKGERPGRPPAAAAE